MEVVKEIADHLGESPNGVRMILTKAGVYVKKTPAAKSSGGSTGGGRVSVSDAQANLPQF
jgi:predicted transcriptional regulator